MSRAARLPLSRLQQSLTRAFRNPCGSCCLCEHIRCAITHCVYQVKMQILQQDHSIEMRGQGCEQLQVNGHYIADLDPLHLDKRPMPVELDMALYGFSDKDLDRE